MKKSEEIKLRSVIKEEVQKISEQAPEGSKNVQPASKAAVGDKSDVSGKVDSKKLAAALKIDEPTLKVAINAAIKGDPSKGKELLALVKALVDADPEASKEVGKIFSKVSEKNENVAQDLEPLTERWQRLAGIL